MKSKKKTLKLRTAKARKKRREKYIKTIVEPAERLAELIIQMQKRKTATSRLQSAAIPLDPPTKFLLADHYFLLRARGPKGSG